MSNGTILVTGCAGLFGTNISRYLTSSGHKVVGIDDLSGGYKEYIDPKLAWFQEGSLTELKNLESVFKGFKPDYVIHTAAMAAVCLSPFMRSNTYTNNLIGYSNLLNCSLNHGVKRFVHFSTMDVYGKNQTPFLEDMTPMPEEPYGISKYAIELDLKSAHEQFGLNYNIVRPHNVCGMYQNIWDRYRNVLGIWVRKCLNREPITVYGDGSQIRAFSDVKYYMTPIGRLTFDETINQQTYNIGADGSTTIFEAAKITQKVAAKFGYNSEIVHLEPRNEVKEAFPNHDKAKRDLEFVDNTDLELMIIELFWWALHEPNREVKYADYEVSKGLYSYWRKSND